MTSQVDMTQTRGDGSVEKSHLGKRLNGLLVAQFFGAFNDNAWKMLLALLAIQAIPKGAGDYEVQKQLQTMMAFVVFTLPLMLFSLPAGTLADRISKRSVIVVMKALEIALMAFGALLLYFAPAGSMLPLIVLGLMGVQSALFSPAKYGILPELLPERQLPKGNALLEMWTFLAIILGTAAGGLLLDSTQGFIWVSGAVLMVFAVIGFLCSLRVPYVPPVRAEGGVVKTATEAWSAIRGDRPLWLAIAGSIYFWGIASLLGQDIMVYTESIVRDMPNASTLTGIPMAVFGLGVGAGSLLAARLSASKIETGMIPLGCIGISVFTFVFGMTGPGLTWTLILMGLLGISSGLVTVPLHALVQWRSPADRRGAVIAVSNVFVFAAIMGGSLMATGLAYLGVSALGIVLVASVATLCCTIWALSILPEALVRFVLLVFTNTVYRIRVIGRDNIPQEGGALLTPNHVSFIDALLISACTSRPIRFLAYEGFFKKPVLRTFLNIMGAIPISSEGGPRSILRSIRKAGDLLDEGELVCIFAEGQITRTGVLQPFRRGFERIVKGRDVPIVPISLHQVWGSLFSFSEDRFFWKVPRQIPYPVTISFGSHLSPGTPIQEVRQSVEELGCEAACLLKDSSRPLHHTFTRTARRGPFCFAFGDVSRPALSRIRALAGTLAFARALREAWQDQENVGILLPPSIAGALVNLAAAFSGRTSVNLNYTAGRAGLESAARQAELKTIVTNREFLKKARVELPDSVEPIWIEDIAAAIPSLERALALVLAFFAPVRLLERLCGAIRQPTADDPATIIFSSGSTGDPKGVVLSHYNIASNTEAIAQVFPIDASDRILGILPFFHSFGYTSTLWLAANVGIGVVFQPNPLDVKTIGEQVRENRVTFLIGTPTFLRMYLRRLDPGSFGSLRLVMTGAEKLPEPLADAFEDHFGIRPLEGYGVTECSPVIAVSIPNFRAPGTFQSGSRRGSVGHALPGIATRVVDPDTFEPLPPDTPGMLLVRGPNTMQGYLGRPDLTAEVMRDGWYVTGDIVKIDTDGYITIHDRLSRFSKIGGEMVPHGRVEDALHEILSTEERVFAVTAIADEKKGEALAVLHTLNQDDIPGLVKKLGDTGLPNLFIPRPTHFVQVEELPMLGTGKLDLRATKRIAAEALVGAA